MVAPATLLERRKKKRGDTNLARPAVPGGKSDRGAPAGVPLFLQRLSAAGTGTFEEGPLPTPANLAANRPHVPGHAADAVPAQANAKSDTSHVVEPSGGSTPNDSTAAAPAEAPVELPGGVPSEKTISEDHAGHEQDGEAAKGGKDSGGKGRDTELVTQGRAGEAEAPAKKKAPSAREAIAPTASAVRQRAAGARAHSKVDVPVGSAQAAALTPATEKARGAAAATVKGMDAANADQVRREAFKRSLREAIDKATPQPKTENEAARVREHGATEASGALRGELTTQRDAAAGPMKNAAKAEVTAESQPAQPETKLQPEPMGQPPAPVSAAAVVPSPLSAEQLDYSSDRAPTDNAMADAGVTQEQLQKGNEPAFGAALESRSTAETHENKAEGQYRPAEAKVQDKAHDGAQAALAGGLGGMHGTRGAQVGKVVAQQKTTQSKNAGERKRITQVVTGIKDQTKIDVDKILQEMDDEAAQVFEDGLTDAERVYEKVFDDEKGGVGTWLTTWGSDWEQLIEHSLGRARQAYLRRVDEAIDKVADCVDAKLKIAKQRVAAGRTQVEVFVAGLDDSVQTFGKEALESVSADFDALEGEIDQRRDALIDKLAQQYKASYERMSAMEDKLREENKSLWQRVYDATVGLIKKILAFKDMLLSILAKAADVVVDIISDPIGFLGNLVSGVMLGLENFMSNIGAHLKKGLLDWLFGALGGAGIQLPETLDLEGIVSIALQVLGLTYANFRARAVNIVGEPIVAGLEQAAEVFQVILTEGIPGLWRFIKEKLADLQSMVLDAIFTFVEEKVIIAGITWVIGLLNPASAFFKACKAIYDIVMFFIERGSQILALVNAVIDSMASIAKGNIAVAAQFVEDALANAIPVAIGFLASLLGLGDISGEIRKIIDKAQAPINEAIDWVIHQAVKLVKAAGKFVGGLFGGETDDKKSEMRGTPHEQAVHDVVTTLQRPATGELPSYAQLRAEKEQEAANIMAARNPLLAAEHVKLSIVFKDQKTDQSVHNLNFSVRISPNDAAGNGAIPFPEPVAGLHVVKRPDECKNVAGESHHVPAKGLGSGISQFLGEIVTELRQGEWKNDPAAQAVADAFEDRSTENGRVAKEPAEKLSAILVRPEAHTEDGGVHTIEGSGPVLLAIAENPRGRAIVVVKRRTQTKIGAIASYIAVNPQIRSWRLFLADIHRAINDPQFRNLHSMPPGTERGVDLILSEAEKEFMDADESSERFLQDRVVARTNKILDISVSHGYKNGKATITTAMTRANDGTPEGRQAALSSLDGHFGSSWAQFRKSIRVSFPPLGSE